MIVIDPGQLTAAYLGLPLEGTLSALQQGKLRFVGERRSHRYWLHLPTAFQRGGQFGLCAPAHRSDVLVSFSRGRADA